MEAQNLLDEALGALAVARQGLMAELENLPENRLDYCPGEGGRTVAETVRHVIEAGLVFAGEIAREDGDFWRAPFSVLRQEYCADMPLATTKAELLDLLQTTLIQMDSRIRDAGADHLLGSMRGITGNRTTRLATLHFAVSHEFYHTGQVALCARAMGIVPALTRRFQPA